MKLVHLNVEENQATTGDWLNTDTQLKMGDRVQLGSQAVSLGAVEDDQILGRLVASIFFNSMHIALFAVKPESRSHGVGSFLIDQAETIARDNHCTFITLETMSFNAPAFYKKHGYQVMHEFKDSPVTGTSHYYFYKDL
ncbi:hypothetical protein AYR62_05725 [Secundilactobacillus paracollinoides]|uniref:N-acetyltransferase domain-containing protein n=1 Tax=Secundilactobacillus paracollinoides TaxID=240427 RepID=A0A1B2J0Z0_9LACO|nr:GNAT family N-acetyltransferase [Secundilactobacillus paracollinoides]ANZ61952.1 hypothetical protein AYR61_11735 [Secundilactobacillus paracollinoides]ANZ63639.1 hypothetical protein AYR62_05725 [Secundilactobacillus paracollinoides]ANZ67898.1 hypothetical protein AYR63_12630 [Secundilactobacillus paracollinoides]